MGYYATGFLEMLSSFEFVLFLFLFVIINLSRIPWKIGNSLFPRKKGKFNFLKSIVTGIILAIIIPAILTVIISTVIDYIGFGLYGKYKEEMIFFMGFILLLLFLYIVKKKLR